MNAVDPVRGRISDLISSHHVVLFMKGTRRAPQCGFSAKVVQILDEHLASYEAVDVLASPELREGIKQYSNWPTIPQLYVGGKFVGGSDIVGELDASGELQALLGAAADVEPPALTISDAAKKAFEAALADAGPDLLRFDIGPRFEYDLYLGPRKSGDVEVSVAGLTILLDRASARRTNGVHIDFVEGERGGFEIQNPNEPPKVRSLSPSELKTMLDRGEITLFDVRPEAERALASIEQARPLDAGGREYLLALDRKAPIAFVCHHGVRSRNAADQVLAHGFERVYNVEGGIDAWSLTVDPAVPRY